MSRFIYRCVLIADIPVMNDCFRVTRSKTGVFPIEQIRALSTSSNVTEYDVSVLSMDKTVPLDLSSLVQDHERSPDTPFLKHIVVESSPLLTVPGINTLNTDLVASNCDSGSEVESVISSKEENPEREAVDLDQSDPEESTIHDVRPVWYDNMLADMRRDIAGLFTDKTGT